ncbi:MAG TPA: hemolysin family protein [Acidimicrobiia bacterium]|nr:hemolysin family protein [Acidimicrobiia bacterium]
MNWGPLVFLVLLLLANGFFVAAEFAYITARRSVLEQAPGRSAQIAVGLNRNLSLSLTAAQLGITMASLGLGAVAEPAVAHLLEQALGFLPVSEAVIHVIALIIALLIVVFLHMVIGEMAPKNIAISSPERSATTLARLFRGFIILFRPLIGLLNAMANGVLRLFGVKPADSLEVGHSADDLAVIIATGQRDGVIEDFTHRLLSGAIIFGDLDAAEAMIPRPDVVAVPVSSPVADIEQVMRDTGHSRIPVYGETLDDIHGFVHVKDLMGVSDDATGRSIEPGLLRRILFVPESAHIRSVLDEMRRTRIHFAVVVDEHGSTAGIITMEDIAEELVGEISDEHDFREHGAIRTREGRIIAPGLMRPDQLVEFGVRLPEGHYETIGGLVMDRLGRLPVAGDVIEEEGWKLVVTRTDGRRVREVELTPSTTDRD